MKPLGHKSYGSIPHLPGSRRGPADKGISESQAAICLTKTRDRHDVVIVQEKLDGTNVAVAKINGEIVPLVRSGYVASSSPFAMHQKFHDWAMSNRSRFDSVLKDGERICGEWLYQAHGTRYELRHEPFVAFDIMSGHDRIPFSEFMVRVVSHFIVPSILSNGPPLSIEAAMMLLDPVVHGAIDPIEGAVWRVERHGQVDFLAKYVRPEKVDGCYLESRTSGPPVLNCTL